MKWLLLFVCICGVAAEESILRDYHEFTGIPEATRIKLAEEAQDFDGSRIVGGQLSALGAHPHLAGLLISLTTGQISMCGATLLSNTKLVTAAHCWRTNNFQGFDMTVALGSLRLFSGGTRVYSNTVEVHANYNPTNLNNDIAMITIPWVSYTDTINKIELPSGFLLYLTFEGNVAQAAGYGRTSDSAAGGSNQDLREVNLLIVSNLDCQAVYGFETVRDTTICTSGLGRVGTCSGDSGGPLTVTLSGVRYLVGVTSFVSGSGCEIGFPAGYARVTMFTNWLNARL